jgi:hypothetical protein
MANDPITEIALQIAERIRDKATIQGRIPFLSGDLKKSIEAEEAIEAVGLGEVTLTSNLVYARAVHDGRPELTIKAKNGKFLAWPVKVNGRFLSLSKNNYRLTKKQGKKSEFMFAKEVTQKARAGRPFIQEGADEMEAQGFDFLNPLLKEYVSDEIAAQIVGSIELDFKL